jgi:hypothetical protein
MNLVLFSLFLLISSANIVLCDNDEEVGENEEPVKEAPMLTPDSLRKAIAEDDIVFVMFLAPW